jgi:hypothetical protein
LRQVADNAYVELDWRAEARSILEGSGQTTNQQLVTPREPLAVR